MVDCSLAAVAIQLCGWGSCWLFLVERKKNPPPTHTQPGHNPAETGGGAEAFQSSPGGTSLPLYGVGCAGAEQRALHVNPDQGKCQEEKPGRGWQRAGHSPTSCPWSGSSQTSLPRGRTALGPGGLLQGRAAGSEGSRGHPPPLVGVSGLMPCPPSCPPRWYKLHSKPGKKEKERGEIQLSLQFTRPTLTASMFDLSVKEKPRSPFRRLKDKMTGKHRYDLDSSSAIVPSSSGALDEDLRPGPPKEKARGGFFFRSQLHRSSLTGSSTSLGSASTLSSASSLGGLGSAEGAPSPSRHSSLSTDPAGK